MTNWKAIQAKAERERRELQAATTDVVSSALKAAPLLDVKANAEFADLRRAVTRLGRASKEAGVIPHQPESKEDLNAER